MYYCDKPLINSSGVLVGDQYTDLNMVNVGNPYPSSLTAADTICKSFDSGSQSVNGVFSFSSDLATLQTLFDTYFAFDASIFEMIIGAIIVTFAVGFGAGGVIKVMSHK
jgi:hypothetical protein